jgi:hypothetical protein
MRWTKLGSVFAPRQGAGWMRSHAQVPTPLLGDGFIRVYFSSRPERTLSLLSYVDLSADDPRRILSVCQEPVLPLGDTGSFDEHGIMPSCAVRRGDLVYLYYSGWSRSASVPYINSTGVAVSEDGGASFRKLSAGPILGRDFMNPYSATSPWVTYEAGQWNMWYCSGTGWVRIDHRLEHVYDIRHATSSDGIAWTIDPGSAVTQRDRFEAITRPTVWRHAGDGLWQMLFCYRGSHDFRDGAQSYRMGFARSWDGLQWQRDDAWSGLSPSAEGCDATMVAYPAILIGKGKRYLFYNGNDFGAQGFCCAELADDGAATVNHV